MDEMQDYEVAELYNNLRYADRNMYEIGRLVSYFCCLPYMKEKTNIQEFLSLPWDESDTENTHNIEITNDEIASLKEMAEYYGKKLKDTNEEKIH